METPDDPLEEFDALIASHKGAVLSADGFCVQGESVPLAIIIEHLRSELSRFAELQERMRGRLMGDVEKIIKTAGLGKEITGGNEADAALFMKDLRDHLKKTFFAGDTIFIAEKIIERIAGDTRFSPSVRQYISDGLKAFNNEMPASESGPKSPDEVDAWIKGRIGPAKEYVSKYGEIVSFVFAISNYLLEQTSDRDNLQ